MLIRPNVPMLPHPSLVIYNCCFTVLWLKRHSTNSYWMEWDMRIRMRQNVVEPLVTNFSKPFILLDSTWLAFRSIYGKELDSFASNFTMLWKPYLIHLIHGVFNRYTSTKESKEFVSTGKTILTHPMSIGICISLPRPHLSILILSSLGNLIKAWVMPKVPD